MGSGLGRPARGRWIRRAGWKTAGTGAGAVLVAAVAPAMAPAGQPVARTAITAVAGSLEAADASAPTDVWAVGQTSGGIGKTLALHWNGTGWATAPTPAPGKFGSGLLSVAAISARNAWAVGFANFQTGAKPLVLHWNGTHWARVPSPGPGISALTGVSAVSASDVWAVGDGGPQDGPAQTLVVHWDGIRWSRVASPSPGPQGAILNAVDAVSGSDVWAVGSTVTTDGPGKTLVLHWDGTRWARVPAPSPGSSNDLSGVSMTSASDGWAVGTYTTASADDLSVTLHWDGRQWARVPSPNPGLRNGGPDLTAVSALTGSDAWASGSFNSKAGQEVTLLLHWNAGAQPGPWRFARRQLPRRRSHDRRGRRLGGGIPRQGRLPGPADAAAALGRDNLDANLTH